MNEDHKTRIQSIYEEWLMDTFPEDISCKDELIDKVDQGYEIERFFEEIKYEAF